MKAIVWRKILLSLILVFSWHCLNAQEDHVLEAVRRFSGEMDVESLDNDLVEALYALFRDPVRINTAGQSTIQSSGLFTPYQAASLADYISRHGYICSLTELSSVDGFTPEYVETITPFISLEHIGLNPDQTRRKVFGEASLRGGCKVDPLKDISRYTYALKARVSFKDRYMLNLSLYEPYDSLRAYPTVYSASFILTHRRVRIIAGDFNARFGQGLCLWNTASFSSLTSPSTFMKRPSGISAVNSFTGSTAMTGLASDFTSGRWKVSALVNFPDIKKALRKSALAISPAVNLCRYGRLGHLAFTQNMTLSEIQSSAFRIPDLMSSVDGSCCLKGVNIFGEATYDWVRREAAGVLGAECRAGEYSHLAALVRYLPRKNEHGAAFAMEMNKDGHMMTLSLDAMYDTRDRAKDGSDAYRVKGQLNWNWVALSCLELKVRVSERFQTWDNRFKTQVRSDLVYTSQQWKTVLRLEAVEGVNLACLGYVEGGYIGRRISAYIRYGLFHVDDWDDRIYVYERDAPGNFNVPAFYGRGMWSSIYISSRFGRWGRAYLRGILKKPGNAELKFQFTLLF